MNEPAARAEGPTRTVERALGLLAAVCERGESALPLADAARETGLSASTALRLLRTLESQGFVRKGRGGYRPGLRIIQLGAQVLGNDSLVALADVAMKRLVAHTGESAYLNVRVTAEQGVYIAVAEGTHSVRHTSWVGRAIPLTGTAAGAVLDGEVAPGQYIVVDDGVETDVTAIAAPVTAGGRTVAALSVVAPSYRISREQAQRIGAMVAAESQSILRRAADSDNAAGSDGMRNNNMRSESET